ncbi:alpha/beta hydrolase [Pseudoalteromonas mariniglutinosa]|uniref:alpha/beta hydrolase n=1 Tax=Pseudoalteromonas mariniglutinosa TaxID=206042 RepID=UPI003850DBFD
MSGIIKLILTTVITLFSLNTHSLESEMIVNVNVDSGVLEGTFLKAENSNTVALIISGSGPTDRNGNNPSMINNSLKMVAEELKQAGISSLRYDKRGVGASANAGLVEENLRFEHYINDAKKWLTFLNSQNGFEHITVIGHSEGALIGMIVAQSSIVDSFVSIAGAGQSADKIIQKQLTSQPASVSEPSIAILEKLVHGKIVDNVPPSLGVLFRPSVQPYLISWFRYDPLKEFKKLKKPLLILQGDTDIQVSVEQAKLLHGVNRQADLKIIEGMNHVLKEAPLDKSRNIQTYNDPKKPVMPEVFSEISQFLKENA